VVSDVLSDPSTGMDPARARALAERLHAGQRDRDGTSLIDHVRRVAAAVPRDARAVAWLHEALEHTSISEQALLAEGLSHDELRAIRLLTRAFDPTSDAIYLAHIERIARADGPGAGITRTVKRADLADRTLHPLTRANGWLPPYALGQQILGSEAPRDSRTVGPAARAKPGRRWAP
jgi:hypothetical protein